MTEKMLAEFAEAAMMQVEAESQPDDPDMAVDNVTEKDGVQMGHISKEKPLAKQAWMLSGLVTRTGLMTKRTLQSWTEHNLRRKTKWVESN